MRWVNVTRAFSRPADTLGWPTDDGETRTIACTNMTRPSDGLSGATMFTLSGAIIRKSRSILATIAEFYRMVRCTTSDDKISLCLFYNEGRKRTI